MPSGYSPWAWSSEHQRHYCWRHNKAGDVEYYWSGRSHLYADTSTAQTISHPAINLSEGKDEDGEEGEDKDEDEDENKDEDGNKDEDENEDEDEYRSQPAATAQHQAPSYSHSNQNAPMQYTQSHRTNQQPASPSISPHFTYQQLPYPNSAQQVASLPAHPVNQRKARHIRTGIDGRDDELLDPRYQRVSQQSQANFFCYGRVFMMLWTEPAERDNPGRTRGSTHFSVVKYSETAYCEIRRFIIVCNKGAFSQCVPVQTYRGQGATKPGVSVKDHAVIYTGGEGDAPPPLLKGEGITKQALRVVTDGNEVLDICSRINFGKTYTVEHNVKVLSIGTVAPENIYLLEIYWRLAQDLDGR